MSVRLSVVLAVEDGVDRLPAVLDVLEPQCTDDVELLVCYPQDESGVAEVCQKRSWVTPVAAARG